MFCHFAPNLDSSKCASTQLKCLLGPFGMCCPLLRTGTELWSLVGHWLGMSSQDGAVLSVESDVLLH